MMMGVHAEPPVVGFECSSPPSAGWPPLPDQILPIQLSADKIVLKFVIILSIFFYVIAIRPRFEYSSGENHIFFN